MKTLTNNHHSFTFKTLPATLFLLVAGLVLLNGCDSSTTGIDDNDSNNEVKLNVDPGQYKMKISGNLPTIGSTGKAIFKTEYSEDLDAQVFSFGLIKEFTDQGDDIDTFSLLFYRLGSPPEPGTYSFVNLKKSIS